MSAEVCQGSAGCGMMRHMQAQPAEGADGDAPETTGVFPTLRSCGWCETPHPHHASRRGLCSTCYRKARESGLLPPRDAPGPEPLDALVVLIGRLPPARRAKVLQLLQGGG